MPTQTVALDPAVYGLTGAMNVTVDHQPDGNGGNGGDPLTQARFNEMLAVGLAGLPDYPDEFKVDDKIDIRDLSFQISHDNPYKARLSEYPFAKKVPPVVIEPGSSRTRGTVSITDMGATGESRAADSKAMRDAANKAPDGGTVFVPHGRWLVSNVQMPGKKDLTLQGESELGAELVGVPGHDTLIWSDLDVQRRLQNRQIIKNLRFFMPGNGSLGSFGRQSTEGFKVGAACLAWVQKSQTSDGNRKQAWANSYVTIQNCTARGEKDAVGATFLWSERAMYGLRVENLFIGDHSTTISGLHGGIIMGKPPFPVAEYAPDEFRVSTFVHWGGMLSIAVPNIANGAIYDHKAYACRWPLHLTGLPNDGPRKRGRGLEIHGSYYDNDVVDTATTDQEMLHLAVDNCRFGLIHFKGSKNGRARPILELSGKNIRGGTFEIMDSAVHRAPRFKISGTGHHFAVDAGGVSQAELSTMFNNGPSFPGVTVL